jgi:hypothetical protein
LRATGPAECIAAIAFGDLAGRQTYLRHPAHEQLGAEFGQSLSSALVSDFEMAELARPDWKER